jgi:hypothetical protein
VCGGAFRVFLRTVGGVEEVDGYNVDEVVGDAEESEREACLHVL